MNKNKKGLFWFLALTFIPTYLLEFILFINGYTFIGKPATIVELVIVSVMFFPAIAAFIVRKFITKEGFKDSGLIIGKPTYYLQAYILIPALFIAIYGITWLFIQAPDFSLNSFAREYGITKLPLSPQVLIFAIFVSTITFAPFINAIAAFGEEFGWRGYLLPKLMPLGTKKALIISGIIWGLWHAPLVLIGFHYGHQWALGILFFTIFIMLLGIYIGYLRLVSGSVLIAAFAHGVFNAQAYGVWAVIFPNINPFIGGIYGLVGILILSAVSWFLFRLLKKQDFQK